MVPVGEDTGKLKEQLKELKSSRGVLSRGVLAPGSACARHCMLTSSASDQA